jgi:two-component system chemotaxis response regulator CheY
VGLDRAKIIMTTALNDSKDILSSFRDECDGYLVKPIKKQDIKKLFDMLEITPESAP